MGSFAMRWHDVFFLGQVQRMHLPHLDRAVSWFMAQDTFGLQRHYTSQESGAKDVHLLRDLLVIQREQMMVTSTGRRRSQSTLVDLINCYDAVGCTECRDFLEEAMTLGHDQI